ncbi:helix-turn-helix domain-containing protein [Herbaspirillum autotrophicum]|uniref:helix-turn-helix domain-containing protein n=1 Tax=Herbaspirillum autotrophicum TaxID=180195 RepID=UPI00067E1C15|nr:helix-turn-helix transcriptional regulator [Herbaspirillum autotrophicum]
MSKFIQELTGARKAAGLSQDAEASKAGLNRMTIQKLEAETIDPKLSTLEVLAKVLGMEIMLVPRALRPDLEDFVRSGGRYLGQPAGVDAPTSVVDDLLRQPPESLGTHKRPKGR